MTLENGMSGTPDHRRFLVKTHQALFLTEVFDWCLVPQHLLESDIVLVRHCCW